MGHKTNPISLRLGHSNFWKNEVKNSELTIQIFFILSTLLKSINFILIDCRVQQINTTLQAFGVIKKNPVWFKKTYRQRRYNPRKKFFLNRSATISKHFLKKKIIFSPTSNKNINFFLQKQKIAVKAQKHVFKCLKNKLILLKFTFKLELLLKKLFGLCFKLSLKTISNFLVKKDLILCKQVEKRLRFYRRQKQLAQAIFQSFLTLKFQKCDLLSNYLATELPKLKRHNHFLAMIKAIFTEFYQLKTQTRGLRFLVWGKLGNSKRTRRFKGGFGSLSLQKLNFKSNFNLAHSYTRFGVFGVKVWLIV